MILLLGNVHLHAKVLQAQEAPPDPPDLGVVIQVLLDHVDQPAPKVYKGLEDSKELPDPRDCGG